MGVSKKVIDRITSQLKRYHSILADAKSRDISESDTVNIVRDMLGDVFGYNKFIDVTASFQYAVHSSTWL